MNLKKLYKQNNDLGNSINLIPMINLIFLLLIFFMLTGVVRKKILVKSKSQRHYLVKKEKRMKVLKC